MVPLKNMISYLFFFILPLLLIFAAPVFQVLASVYVLKRKIKSGLFWVNFMSLILGFLLPAGAIIIAVYGLPPGPQCLTGPMSLVFGGIMITVIFVPIIAIIIYLIHRFKRNRHLIA